MDRLSPITLITGAASGIGAACARDLARRSSGGLLLADPDEAALSNVADALERLRIAPERVSTLAFDLTDASRWAQAADFIKNQYGRLDWAIVNAGVAQSSIVADSELVDWRRTQLTNLNSAFLALRAVMPIMGENLDGGAVIVTAPAGALYGEPGDASGASKGGLLNLIRAAANEGASNNVRINAVATGNTSAAPISAALWFQDLVRESGGERAALERITKLTPALARHAGAETLPRLFSLLLSDDSPVTGATLVVDGGYTL